MSQHRKDKNEKQIVDELRNKYNLGVFVSSDVGSGFPDIVVAYNHKNYFIEIKFDKSSKLTPAQVKFHKFWLNCNGQISVCLNTKQVLDVIGYAEQINQTQQFNTVHTPTI